MTHSQPVALVTGGSRGIGRGICQELAHLGYAVAINYAGNRSAAEETQRLLGEQTPTLVCQADVGQSGDRQRLVDEVLAAWNRIDVLVNNAGITSVGRKDILDATEESWDQVLAVNLKGPFFLTQLVARSMIARLDQLQHPTIVNISSVSRYAVSTNRGDYCISKAGQGMLTRLWAARLAEYGILVYEVCPGVIETDMTAGNRERYEREIRDGLMPIRRWGTPEDLGRAVGALVTGQFAFSTGNVFDVDGGFHIRRL